MEKQNTAIDTSNIIIYNVQDVKKILRMSQAQTYNLMNSKAFPSYRINKRIFVTKDSLDKWLEMQIGKTFLI